MGFENIITEQVSAPDPDLSSHASNHIDWGIIMRVLKRSNRFYNTERYGQPEIRVYHKKAQGKKMPRYLLKCGCCDQKLEIYYAEDGLEIGGVNGAIENWRDILLPLLLIERKGTKLVVRTKAHPE